MVTFKCKCNTVVTLKTNGVIINPICFECFKKSDLKTFKLVVRNSSNPVLHNGGGIFAKDLDQAILSFAEHFPEEKDYSIFEAIIRNPIN